MPFLHYRNSKRCALATSRFDLHLQLFMCQKGASENAAKRLQGILRDIWGTCFEGSQDHVGTHACSSSLSEVRKPSHANRWLHRGGRVAPSMRSLRGGFVNTGGRNHGKRCSVLRIVDCSSTACESADLSGVPARSGLAAPSRASHNRTRGAFWGRRKRLAFWL